MEKEIYIIRHGQTDFNALGIVQGRGVDSSINELGRRQAQAFYDTYQHIDFDHACVSTLRRTRESILPFDFANHRMSTHAQLDEISWGIYEGVRSSVEMKHVYRSIVDSWSDGQVNARVEGGESPVDVQKRLIEFIERLRTMPYGRVLVCTHGRALRVLLCTIFDEPLDNMNRFDHGNLCLYVLAFDGEQFRIVKENSKDHLKQVWS